MKVLLNALAALKSGDFSIRLPLDWVGIAGKAADTGTAGSRQSTEFDQFGFGSNAWPQALLPPSNPEPVPAITSDDPIKVTTDQPKTPKQELNLPRSEKEPQKPVSTRTDSKT
jgi:hypothetical protein